MPLHPDARASMEARDKAGVKSVEQLSVADARFQAVRVIYLQGMPEPVHRIEDRHIPGPFGPIPLRLYWPGEGDAWPTLVYYHGGGWVVGNLDTTDIMCRMLANHVGCVVVSVNYRHAPDDKFPAAAEDCYAATQWVADNATSIQVDAARIAMGGSSAGGNLAAAVALMARDRGTPAIVQQTLWVPVTDFNVNTPSYLENAEGYGLTRAAMIWFWNHYLRDAADAKNPYAAPLQAASLAGLPPAHVLTAEYDPLRDEGNAYAARLREAGAPTVHTCYDGMIHGFLGPQAFEDAVRELKRAFKLT